MKLIDDLDANIKYFACDITNPGAVYATAEQVKAAFGAPTILINNAGILASHSILSTSDDYLRKIFDVNVLSNWYTVSNTCATKSVNERPWYLTWSLGESISSGYA